MQFLRSNAFTSAMFEFVCFPPDRDQIAGVSDTSVSGLVSRVTPVHTANATVREIGGPFGFGNQVLISSHRKLLSPIPPPASLPRIGSDEHSGPVWRARHLSRSAARTGRNW